MNPKVIKIGGMIVSVAGAAVSLLSDMINDKKMEAKVQEVVAEALKNVSK